MKQEKIKHIEMVQSIVTRMGSNSFLIKGWSTTVASGLFALAANNSNSRFAIVAILPSLVFWGLDAYYLRQERLFRKLYDDLCLESEEGQRKVELFSMSTKQYESRVQPWFRILWSKTVLPLHGMVVSAIVVVIMILSYLR
jgi:hypothetical protein